MGDFHWLIGKCNNKKLSLLEFATNGGTLCRFMYFHKHLNLIINESARKTAWEIASAWERFKIPVTDQKNIMKNIKKFYEKYILLTKNKNRNNAGDLRSQKSFEEDLTSCFDIAKQSELSNVSAKIREIYELKINGYAVPRRLRRNLNVIHEVPEISEENESDENSSENCEDLANMSIEEDDFEQSETDAYHSRSDSDDAYEPAEKKKKGLNEISLEICQTWDRTSNRNAFFMKAAEAAALANKESQGQVDSAIQKVPSYSTIRRSRIKARKIVADEILKSFNAQHPVMVHWDGKLLPDTVQQVAKKTDNLVVAISSFHTDEFDEKLLGVPKLQSGRGKDEADGVFDILEKWNLSDKVMGK